MPIPKWVRCFPKVFNKKQKHKFNQRGKSVVNIRQTAECYSVLDSSRDFISASKEDQLRLFTENSFNYCQPYRDLTLTDLPDEILLQIVSYISPLEKSFKNLRCTCCRLRAITEDPALFNHRHLRIPAYTTFSFNTLQMVLDVSWNTLRSLDLSDCEDVTDYALFKLVCNFGDGLVKLNVSGCKQLTNDAMQLLGHQTLKLEWLNFSRCPLVTCAGILQLFQHLGKTLTHVNMSNCLGIRKDPHKLTAISMYFTALRHLDVGWSRDLVKLNPLLDMDLDRLTRNCTHLSFLDISYSHSTNTSMGTITANCPQLATLMAKQCFVQDTGLCFIGNSLAQLKHLDLTDCWYITDAGLEHLAKGCKHLQHINLTRCYEIRGNGTIVLVSHCHMLTTVILRQCFRIDDQAIKYVGLRNLQIRRLDVSYNMNVTMDTVRQIRRRRANVRLVTEGCPGVSHFGSKSRFHFYQRDLKFTHDVVRETAV